MKIKKKSMTPVTVIVIIILGAIYGFGGFEEEQVNLSEAQIVSVEAPMELMKVKSEGLAANKFVNALVTKIVDGDTIEVEYKSKDHKVRLLCVDTPESVKQGVEVQPYAKEASAFLKDQLMGKKVKLIFEKGLRDRYGRLLAHVVTQDNSHINSILIRNGYARVEIVSPNRALKDHLYGLQETAISEKRGFWALPEKERPFVKNSKGLYVPQYQDKKKAS